MSHSAVMLAPTALHAHWRDRVRYLLARGEIADASALADQILDELFPTRWRAA